MMFGVRRRRKKNTMPLVSSNSTQTGRCSSGEIFLRFARSSQHVTVDGLELPNNHLRCINPLYMMAQNYLPPRISSIKSNIFVKLSVRKLQSNVDDRHLRTHFRNLAKMKIISLTPSSEKWQSSWYLLAMRGKILLYWRETQVLELTMICNLQIPNNFIFPYHSQIWKTTIHLLYSNEPRRKEKLLLHFPLNIGCLTGSQNFCGSLYSPHNWVVCHPLQQRAPLVIR